MLSLTFFVWIQVIRTVKVEPGAMKVESGSSTTTSSLARYNYNAAVEEIADAMEDMENEQEEEQERRRELIKMKPPIFVGDGVRRRNINSATWLLTHLNCFVF